MSRTAPDVDRDDTDRSDAAPASTGASAPFARECDLVMKGGITSGVVYPLAIAEIARAFRLRSIGGTSAGAIAAAAAAAAELGRQRHRAGELADDPDGFGQLRELPDFLGAPAPSGAGTRLLAFFKPARRLRAVFEVFVDTLAVKGGAARLRRAVFALARRHPGMALLGWLIGLLPLLALAFVPWRWSLLPLVAWVVAIACVLALLGVVARMALRLFRELPARGYGVCSGMPEPGAAHGEEALTVWMSDYFDRLAGQGAQAGPARPLTFGDLRAHGIELRVMTTCLTLGRPFQLPFGDDVHVRENGRFLFRREDFALLFPPRIVDWMVARAPAEVGGVFREAALDGHLGLPAPDDLPVVVAVRMSLSFPLLLSAVPLYSVDFTRPGTAAGVLRRPERCWFTDGGVGSNFPIHFFDAPLSTRPTFGLDLGQADPGSGDRPDQRVRFPDDNADALISPWRRWDESRGVGSVLGFLGTLFGVAKDWNHETLSNLPGFRDRIGLIRLSEREGGLNLTMEPSVIEALTAYGRYAGQQFVVRFGDPACWPADAVASPMNWENHQLIRLRLLLASMSEMLDRLETSAGTLDGTASDYARFFTDPVGPGTYRLRGLGRLDDDPLDGLPATQAGLAHWMLGQLRAIARRVAATIAARPAARAGAESPVDPQTRAPRPPPELKPRPRI